MPTPSKQVIHSVTQNKVQLNKMLGEGLRDPAFYMNATRKHCLIMAGISDVPVEIAHGVMIDRPDLRSTHEEADVIIAQHAIATSVLDKSVRVVCDDRS
jgi:hypothetical protein